MTVAPVHVVPCVRLRSIDDLVGFRLDALIDFLIGCIPVSALAKAGQDQDQADVRILLSQRQYGLRRHGIKAQRTARAEKAIASANQDVYKRQAQA